MSTQLRPHLVARQQQRLQGGYIHTAPTAAATPLRLAVPPAAASRPGRALSRAGVGSEATHLQDTQQQGISCYQPERVDAWCW
jgi:hypothetical protein